VTSKTLALQSQIQNQKSKIPILVTGAHRSGTTWVGKMLAANSQTAYISEPLNLWHRPGVMSAPVAHWYTYICPENEAIFLPALQETLLFQYHFWREVQSLRSRKDLLRMGRDWSIFLKGRLFVQRALLKDPFAVFSALWFAERLGCRVVITVRHPAAFASSLARLGWSFDFNHLLEQPLLMRDYLESFRAEMEGMLATPEDMIGQSALLWRMIYRTVAQFGERFPDFQIVRHEDLSRQPVEGYRALYTLLGLNFDRKVERTILNSSASENPKELSRRKVHSVSLDSQANLANWKRRLGSDDINRLRRLTEDVASLYYPDTDWD
jgi:hypothetical protein